MQSISERDFSKDKRDNMDLADFGDPEKRAFPVLNQDDLDNAARLIGHAGNPDAVKKRLVAIAKRKGLTLPDSWKDDKTEESTATIARPAKKIATLPISWLEYNARSKNGRIYPKATCDAIFRAAQKKLAQERLPDPPSTFVSHEDANGNVNTHLIGGPTKVWQEGNTFWANIDLADTSVARDMLGLLEGRYIRSGSVRILGVELRQDRNYDLPLVVVPEGVEPEFLGIDLTTRPGLADTAYIPQVLYESTDSPLFVESFDFEIRPLEKDTPMPIPLYLQILTETMTPDREAHGRIHDHLAGVLDECITSMHGSESAAFIAAVELSEEGRALAMKHATRLAAAHDESARAMGMTCEGAYNDALGIASDADQDGDEPAQGDDPDNDGESAKGGNNLMTEEEALALLKDKYDIAPKKTELQILQEQVAEQQKQIAALLQGTPPQRQTQATSSLNEQSEYQPESLYEEGDYLAGPLAPPHWKSLANRRVPWPKDIDPKTALHELAPFLAFRLISQEADMRGRDISTIIGPNELV